MRTQKETQPDYVHITPYETQKKFSSICSNFKCAGGEVHDGLAVQLEWLLLWVFHTARSLCD